MPTAATVPAPPCKFRCNRRRMVLVVQVTLHHVGAGHINLKTSRNRIELDTLRDRRKFKLDRPYPNGIEVDDRQTTARLDRGCLIVEMPILKLPTAGGQQAERQPAQPQPAASKSQARARELEEDEELEEADDPAPPARGKKRKKGEGGAAAGVAASKREGVGDADDARLRAILDDAVSADAARKAAGLGKIKRLREEEAAAVQREQVCVRVRRPRDTPRQPPPHPPHRTSRPNASGRSSGCSRRSARRRLRRRRPPSPRPSPGPSEGRAGVEGSATRRRLLVAWRRRRGQRSGSECRSARRSSITAGARHSSGEGRLPREVRERASGRLLPIMMSDMCRRRVRGV